MRKNKFIVNMLTAALLVLPLGFALHALAATPGWNVTGNYVVNINYLGTDYPHDMSLTQDSSGNLTGHGGSPAGSNVYTWVIDSGSVSGNSINFTAHYTATADAVTPLTIFNVTGTIASDGTMSGTWSDNYQGGSRTGTWVTISGNAVLIAVTTNPATSITSTDAILNGINGGSDATGHSFWVATSTFSTASPTIPSGVYSTPDFGAIASNTPFSASLSSITTTGVPTNLPSVTSNTTYYFAAWSLVNGTWHPGEILNFTTASSTVVTPPTPTNKDQCKNNGWTTFKNPSFRNQGQCVSYVEANSKAGKQK